MPHFGEQSEAAPAFSRTYAVGSAMLSVWPRGHGSGPLFCGPSVAPQPKRVVRYAGATQVVQPNSETLGEDSGQPVARLTLAQFQARSAWLTRLARHADGALRVELTTRASLAALYALRSPGAVLFGRKVTGYGH